MRTVDILNLGTFVSILPTSLTKMVFKKNISAETRAYARLLRNNMGMSLRQIAETCNISHSSASRITKTPLSEIRTRATGVSEQTVRPGRPRAISLRTERYMERELIKMQQNHGTFYVSDLMTSTGVASTVISPRSVRRTLNRKGYRFVQTRRKGVLTAHDFDTRVRFAKQMLKKYPAEFWTNDIAFYLDGVSFTFKTNPYEHARSPGSRIWRTRSQGLNRGCTSKGKKEGTGGKYVKLIVAISHGKGIVKCESFDRMSGDYFAHFIRDNFEQMFDDADKDSSTWVQDGDPSQNSKKAKDAMREVKANLLSIPPRSPDINPIENIFHMVSKTLNKDAIGKRIQRENLAEFEQRVVKTLRAIPVATIDKTIASMHRRLNKIIKKRGGRIKY